MSDFTNFRAVYDELTDEVIRAHYQFLPDHLRNWFDTLDSTPGISGIIRRLQSGIDFDAWLRNAMQSRRSMAGSGRLSWPEDREQALGMKLLLFRSFAQNKQDISQFGFHFIYVGNNINANAQAVIEQIFAPMARELRRLLEREISEIPAADRIVRLDHNSSAYREAIEALDTLERVIREANDYPDVEDKERLVAEVSAARRLFDATSIRVAVIVSLLAYPTTYLVKKFVDTGIGKAAGAVIDKLTTLFGSIF